jgi:hypothetical protein
MHRLCLKTLCLFLEPKLRVFTQMMGRTAAATVEMVTGMEMEMAMAMATEMVTGMATGMVTAARRMGLRI